MVWTSVLHLEIHPVTTDWEPNAEDAFFCGCVQLTGAWKGAVVFYFSTALAQTATKRMFPLDDPTSDPENLYDALRELSNMIAGNLKSLLPEPSQLSLPKVAQSDEAFKFPNSTLLTRTTFNCVDLNNKLMVLIFKFDESAYPEN
ncbi:MAG: chemotaxis protein CheX [Nitrospinae bacterium]|nr:chemotaxis protein CheX [Nitrospinota bacterium]